MTDATTDTTEPRPSLDYEQVKAMLEMEIQRLQGLQELQRALHDIRAWLNNDDDRTDGKGRDA